MTLTLRTIAVAVGTAAAALVVPAVASAYTPGECFGKPYTIQWQPGETTIQGTSGPDVIFGGDAVVYAGGGDDRICGNVEFPAFGQGGDDRIQAADAIGGAGDDVIRDGIADYSLAPRAVTVNIGKKVATGWGTDTLDHVRSVVGSVFPDLIVGGAYGETVLGGPGDDVIIGRDGQDHLDGGDGADEVHGDVGDDVISSGSGADTLYGGRGYRDILWFTGTDGLSLSWKAGIATSQDVDDRFHGIDVIIGTTGDDFVGGTHGPDWFQTGGGDDYVSTGPGIDHVDVDTLGAAVGYDGSAEVHAGGGDDVIWLSTVGASTVDAGDGNDTVDGHMGSGDDTISGGTGDDYLDAGSGTDYVDGGDGTDTCLNGETVVNCEP